MPKGRARKAVMGLVAVAVVGGGTFIKSQTGTSGAAVTTDVVKRSTTSKTLSATGGVESTVLAVTLPAGNWVIHADDSAAGLNQPQDVVRCYLVAPGIHAGHATQIGNTDGFPLVAQLSGTIGVHLTATTTITNRCAHDNTNGGTYTIDPDAAIWAHRSDQLLLSP